MSLFGSNNFFAKPLDVFTAGAASAGGLIGDGKPPANPYGAAGKKYLKLLSAYRAGLPAQLAMDKEFQPQFTQQQLLDFQNALTGVNGQPGYLDLYKNTVVPAMSQIEANANRATRTANIGDLNTLGPGALTAIQGANPDQTALMKSLTQSATNQMNLGTVLDPNQVDQINQMVLGDWANRGLGTSNPAQLDQAMQYFGGGQQLLQQREANAGAVAGMQNQFYTDPIMRMLMGNSDASQTGQALTSSGAAFGFGGATVLPMDQATSMLGGASTAASNASIAAGNNSGAMTGAGIGAAGAIGGAALLAF